MDWTTRALRYALAILLVAGFLWGGSAQISGVDDTLVQLFSLGVMGYALWVLSNRPAALHRNLALALAAAILLVPLLQLSHIPQSLWRVPDARSSLAADLTVVGVVPTWRWSLNPAATLHAAWFLVPPLAAFVATLALPADSHRSLLRIVLGLALLSLLLAFVQLGVPSESPLNPFPEWAARFNGVFANQNHQAISLVLAVVIALAGVIASMPGVGRGTRQAWTPWVLGFFALFALAALPLTGSRAAVLIAVFAVAAVPMAMSLFDRRHLRNSRWARVGLVGSLGLVVLGVWGTVGWMQADLVDELRAPLRAATLDLGRDHAPLGTGIGAFVAAFEQGGPDALLLPNYVNHAHNDFLQWWMEAGWLGVLVSASVIGFLGFSAARALSRGPDSRALAVPAVIGLAALLLQSWVDYPLRTGSLAIVAAVLAGIVVSRATPASTRTRVPVVGENRDGRHTS